jgi:hypothetical protein
MRRDSNPRPWVSQLCIAALLAIGAAGIAGAQDRGAPATGLFASETPLKFRLEMPVQQVTGSRKSRDPDYFDARLVYTGADDAEVALDLRVRVRGKSRAEVCPFPPILLNFKAKELDGTWFDGENKLKLVTHCMSSEIYEHYELVEYLNYRVLNLLTDMSLRVRPVEVTYYDSKREREFVTKPAFLIEDEERFAARHGLHLVTDEQVERGRYDQAALALVEMFQYFAGNTDWSATQGPKGKPCCHNVVPMTRDDGTVVPIAYDFDSTGIVNPPYALPDARLPIRNIRSRLYRGPCRDAAEITASYEPFQSHRAEIVALFDAEQARLGKTGDAVRSYIDDFYETLASPEKSQRAFSVNCPK